MNRLNQTPPSRGSLRILVAHSSPAVRDRFTRILATCRSTRVILAASATETNRPAAVRRFDLIFLSSRLRGGTGVSVLLELKLRYPKAFVVMIGDRTGAPVEMMKYLAAGAGLFVSRDVIEAQVPSIVHHFMRRTASARVSQHSRARLPRLRRERIS